MRTYHVAVQTGTNALNIFDGAGTSAETFITLFGNVRSTPELRLPIGSSGFVKGALNQFDLQSVEIGQVREIRLRSDGTGASPAWFVDFVDVDGVRFPVNVFLQSGRLSVFALPTGLIQDFVSVLDPPSAADAGLRVTTYEVRFRTADKFLAGTDARISFHLIGEFGISERVEFTGETAQGEVTHIVVPTKNIGDIAAVQVMHDNAGPNPGWSLESIDVFNANNGRTNHFVANVDIQGDGQSLTRYIEASGPGTQVGDLQVKATVDGLLQRKSAAMFDAIAKSPDEQRILATFLNNFRTGAGLDFFTQFTSSGAAPDFGTLVGSQGDPLFTGADRVIWDSRIKKQLVESWISGRSFTIGYFDRLKSFIDQLAAIAKDEIAYARDFFSLENLPSTDQSTQGAIVANAVLGFVGTGISLAGPEATLGVAALQTLVSIGQGLTEAQAKEVTDVNENGRNPLTLAGLGLTLRFNLLIRQLEAGRQRMLSAALTNRGLMNQFTILQSEAIQGRGEKGGVGGQEQFLTKAQNKIIKEIWMPFLRFRAVLLGEEQPPIPLSSIDPSTFIADVKHAMLRDLSTQDSSIIAITQHRHPKYRPLLVENKFFKWSVALVPLGWPDAGGQPAKFSQFVIQSPPMKKLDAAFELRFFIAQFLDDNNRVYVLSSLVGSSANVGNVFASSVGTGELFDKGLLGPVNHTTPMRVPLQNAGNFEVGRSSDGQIFRYMKICGSGITGSSSCVFYIDKDSIAI